MNIRSRVFRNNDMPRMTGPASSRWPAPRICLLTPPQSVTRWYHSTIDRPSRRRKGRWDPTTEAVTSLTPAV